MLQFSAFYRRSNRLGGAISGCAVHDHEMRVGWQRRIVEQRSHAVDGKIRCAIIHDDNRQFHDFVIPNCDEVGCARSGEALIRRFPRQEKSRFWYSACMAELQVALGFSVYGLLGQKCLLLEHHASSICCGWVSLFHRDLVDHDLHRVQPDCLVVVSERKMRAMMVRAEGERIVSVD